MRAFTNEMHCEPGPTTAPTLASNIQFPTAHSPWKDLLPKITGFGAVLVAVGVCACAINRRMQARQVWPVEAEGVEMERPSPAVVAAPALDRVAEVEEA